MRFTRLRSKRDAIARLTWKRKQRSPSQSRATKRNGLNKKSNLYGPVSLHWYRAMACYKNACCWHWGRAACLCITSLSESALGLHSPGSHNLWRGGPRDTIVAQAWAVGKGSWIWNLIPLHATTAEQLVLSNQLVGCRHKFSKWERVRGFLA